MAPSKPDYLAIGQITAPRGVKGEVKAVILTDFPERFLDLGQVYLGPRHEPYELESARFFKQWVLLKFEGIDGRDAVESLRGLSIEIPIEAAIPLAPDVYYEHEIIGLEAWTEDGERLGVITEIIYTGSNDVYVIDRGGTELLIPALDEVVLNIDLDQGRMLVHLMEGL